MELGVRFKIGEEDAEDDEFSDQRQSICRLYVELYDLHTDDSGQVEWQRNARWIKYEEDTEGLDHHWGRPHVAFLSFHSLIQLRRCLNKGVVMLNLAADNYSEILANVELVLQNAFQMDEKRISEMLSTLHMKQKPPLSSVRETVISQIERNTHGPKTVLSNLGLNIPRNRSEAGNVVRKAFSVVHPESPVPGMGLSEGHTRAETKRERSTSTTDVKSSQQGKPDPIMHSTSVQPKSVLSRKFSIFAKPSSAGLSGVTSDPYMEDLMKKLPDSAETAQVFVGTLSELRQPRLVMVRLKAARYMPELLEAPIPIRFLFFILGPWIVDLDYHELGRSISTLMSNEVFHEIANKAESKEDLVGGIDDFLEESIVIPPGEIDSKKLLSVDVIKRAQRRRKQRKEEADREQDKMVPSKDTPTVHVVGNNWVGPKAAVPKDRGDPLKRSGRFFGGLIDDIKWRLPWYFSDYKDALHFQCLTSMIFMFFAAFAPAITFGGLLGSYTEEAMGISETLLAQCLCGVIWGLVSAQPLLVMSATGPVMIFEASLYKFCIALDLPFMTVRVWAGIWLTLIAFVTVMFEGSFLVRYITRFTEDVFATLISVIFIAESIKFIISTIERNPVLNLRYYNTKYAECLLKQNDTVLHNNSAASANCSFFGPHLYDDGFQTDCDAVNQPDTGLLTAFLVVATFMLSWGFKKLRSSYYLGRTARNFIGDFGVLLSIIIVGLIDAFIISMPYLTRLDMPAKFGFTNAEKRGGGILIPVVLPNDKWYGYLFALFPALLVYILLFVETEITDLFQNAWFRLIISKKERGLRKGSGFHWDLMLVGVCGLLCSLLGLPWMCAAAVQSLAHASSLAVMKRHAPGERPHVDYVIEQRVTTIGAALLVGACAFAGSLLNKLAMAVLFGVFLFLGVVNLVPVQFIHRLVLLLIPEKYFPDVPYCRKVQMWRMHAFTILQLLCLGLVYIVKSFKQSSMVFPFAIMCVALVRLFLLPRVFKQNELEALDGEDEDNPETEFENEDFPYEMF